MRPVSRTCCWIILLGAWSVAHAGTDYYYHVLFDNSIAPDSYYYSGGRSVFPSSIQLRDGNLPVEARIFFTPPNALRLEWRSKPGGSWQGEVRNVSIRNRVVDFRGDTLYIWCYAPQAIPAASLPQIQLEDTDHDFTAPVRMDRLTGDMPAGQWVQLKLPLS